MSDEGPWCESVTTENNASVCKLIVVTNQDTAWTAIMI